MRDRTVFYLAGLTLLSVFLLWVGWEFVVEDVIRSLFWSDYEEESLHHRWEYVISGTTFAGIALIIPTLVSLRSVTERKRAEETLRESEERFKAFIHHAPAIISFKDIEGRYLLTNRRHERLLGRPSGQVTGKTAYDVYPAREADAVMAHHRDVVEAGSAIQREETHMRDGKIRTFLTVKFPLPDAAGNPAAVGSIAIDITERKEAEAQLIQASKLATLGEMASGIAHELNQPLSVVGMAAELSLMSMEEGEFDTECVRKKLETIVGQRDRMAEIIDHMRLFSRTDNVKLESFNPVDAVAGGIRLIEQQFRAAGIELEKDCPADCRNISGYPLQLEQVVLNLLTNARDAVLATSAASGNGSPAPKVRVSLVDDKRRKTVVISVADNGGGIPGPALERIFDPFFTTKTEDHGTGLGLSISYSIIDAMGGRLEAQNTEGGAVFRISLPAPLNGAGAVDRGKGKKRKTRTKRRRARLPRVLVVDDEEAIVKAVAEYLGREGYDVATARNGREALDLQKSRPADVVVTDLFMPEMSGAELMRRLHKSDPDLPIVVVTGHTTFGDDRDVVAEGASVVLKKPITLSELTDSLKELGRW